MLSSHFVDRFLQTMRENTWSMAGMTGTKSVYNGLVVTKTQGLWWSAQKK